jgi:diguanylate cyclase (GGDEF)-like protein
MLTTILVVDDHALDRSFLASLLGYVGYKVLQASDGPEAIDTAARLHPDLIIANMSMPTMGGAEFADCVHDDASIAKTPIIFYAASYQLAEARILAKSCRVSAVLAKPAEPQDMLDAVGAALGTNPIDAPTNSASRPCDLPSELPEYLRDATGLQRLLQRTLDQAIERAECRRVAATESDAVEFSFHSLSLRLATLLELDVALSSERVPEEMLKLFCRSAQGLMNCKYAAVAIVDPESRRAKRIATRGLDGGVEAGLAALDYREGLFADLIASGRAHCANDDGELSTTLGLPAFHPCISSLLAVPIPVQTSAPVVGWVYFAEKSGSGQFDVEDEQFAMTLVAQLALAYGNLALYDKVHTYAATLEIEVNERRRAEAELAHRITHDQVTGLPRFIAIEGHLQSAIAACAADGGRVVFLYVDIDGFHAINETRGHAAGDDVLRMIAARLIAICGKTALVAHVAADEFAVVVIDAGDAERAEIAEAVRSGVEKIIHREGQCIYATSSIGVSSYPENGSAPQELLRQAEAAMLRAKNEGRNAVCVFSNEHKQALADRTTLGARLSDAIRDDQLVVHYQPQVAGDDWRILGFEALVRWQSPEFGLLMPARFIGVAEDLGLIVEIGNFVLDTICALARTWLDAGWTDFSVSINISSLQLQRPEFVETIRAALLKHAVPAHHLELELTEGAMVGNVDRAIGIMRALKALGVQLALDDFGTGYSSLNYLRRFPIDKLKIDQSFVRDIKTDAGAAGICRAIITLGHELNMTVLAEGVETAEQVDHLRRQACDQFQGFYFGRALPAPQALALLQSHRRIGEARESKTRGASNR